MKPEIIKVCETFSEGDAQSVAHFISESVIWEMVGERQVEGLSRLLQVCEEMTSEGCASFKNRRTTIAEHQVVIEGSELREGGGHYCDCYRILNDRICEIRSYFICARKN